MARRLWRESAMQRSQRLMVKRGLRSFSAAGFTKSYANVAANRCAWECKATFDCWAVSRRSPSNQLPERNRYMKAFSHGRGSDEGDDQFKRDARFCGETKWNATWSLSVWRWMASPRFYPTTAYCNTAVHGGLVTSNGFCVWDGHRVRKTMMFGRTYHL